VKGWRAPNLCRSSRDETGVRVLDSDQLHVGHGNEVAEVGGVVERVPVAYLDRGDANRHGALFVDAHSVAKELALWIHRCVNAPLNKGIGTGKLWMPEKNPLAAAVPETRAIVTINRIAICDVNIGFNEKSWLRRCSPE
jgi:hypothetical protein